MDPSEQPPRAGWGRRGSPGEAPRPFLPFPFSFFAQPSRSRAPRPVATQTGPFPPSCRLRAAGSSWRTFQGREKDRSQEDQKVRRGAGLPQEPGRWGRGAPGCAGPGRAAEGLQVPKAGPGGVIAGPKTPHSRPVRCRLAGWPPLCGSGRASLSEQSGASGAGRGGGVRPGGGGGGAATSGPPRRPWSGRGGGEGGGSCLFQVLRAQRLGSGGHGDACVYRRVVSEPPKM